MRHVATILGLGILVTLAGCSSTRWGFVKNNDHPATPAGSTEPLSAAQLVEYLNNNADRIQGLRVEELELTCTQGIKSFGLRGTMVAEKKRNFRLVAKTLGNPVVDLGSNDQEFWYWISKGDPYQFYCAYKDLEEGRVRRMPFPFQPEWVMESMGLGPYGPPEKYQLERDADTIRLVEKTKSPQGTPVRKVIVIKANPVQLPNAQVTDYLLLDDASAKEICGAHISEVQIDRATGAIVPKRIALHWPLEKLTLALRLDELTLNPQVPREVFRRLPMRDVQSFNLARGQIDNTPPPNDISSVRPVQGFGP
ncbi:MAG TPA: hypothetical protein VNX28_01090 [Gemmataceae bacterium]|nr:hypothetical protein [Gemmataceae bacterium]